MPIEKDGTYKGTAIAYLGIYVRKSFIAVHFLLVKCGYLFSCNWFIGADS